jgi:hypothetical protein
MTTLPNESYQNDELCGCGQTFAWHQDNQPRHPFARPGSVAAFLGSRRDRDHRTDGKSSQRGSQGASMGTATPVVNPWPFDPVLRQALIDKSVLTPDDLRTAEAKIREMSVVFNQGGSAWSATREVRPDSSIADDKTSTGHSDEKASPSP